MKWKSRKRYLFAMHKRLLMEYDLDAERTWRNPYGITYEVFDESDFPLFEDILRSRDFITGVSPDEARKRLREKNFILFVAKQNGRIIGYNWMVVGQFYIDFLEATIYLKKDETYGVFSFVRPDARGYKVLGGLLAFAFDYFKKRGYRRALGMHASSNMAAVKTYAKMDTKILGEVTYGYFLTLKYLWIPYRGIEIKGDPFVFWKRIIKNRIRKMRFRRLGADFRRVDLKPVQEK